MKRIFEIEFPDECGELWMNVDNLMLCINAYCSNKDGKIRATDVTNSPGQALKKQAREINACYNKPFLPRGFVKARVTDYGTLWLDIGDRNGEFDTNGERVGAGTNVGGAREWNIQRIKKP